MPDKMYEFYFKKFFGPLRRNFLELNCFVLYRHLDTLPFLECLDEAKVK
jgi:hypothetical protein